MLKIWKGKAVKYYENQFFRKFSKEIEDLFEERGWDGLLIGMPVCTENLTLAMDCLLVTEERMIIIDFKQYRGTLELPAIDGFERGLWTIDDNLVVKGGSSLNPFKQLGVQRGKFKTLLERHDKRFTADSLSTMVCFHHPVDIVGRIPDKHSIYFSIIDPNTFRDEIEDFLDVSSGKNINYLSPEWVQFLTDSVFKAESYSPSRDEEIELPVPIRKVTTLDENVINKVDNFLRSNQQIMLFTGNTKGGKTGHITEIQGKSFHLGYEYAPIFTYSNRFKRKINRDYPEIEELNSIFSELYNFADDNLDENYKKTYDLNMPLDSKEHEKELYIIDDSHLISNTVLDNTYLQFGSGELLNDLLDYLALDENPNRKVLFIGDTHKLSYGSIKESVLSLDYLKNILATREMTGDISTVELSDFKSQSPIIQLNNQIAERIEQEMFTDLIIEPESGIHLLADGGAMSYLKEVCEEPQKDKILTYTNKQAYEINHHIKGRVLHNGTKVAERDYISINSDAEFLLERNDKPTNETINVSSGQFGTILNISEDYMINKTIILQNNEIVDFKFIFARIRLDNGQIGFTYLFKNYLNKVKSELTLSEEVAYQILLKQMESAFFSENPFERSPEFQSMLKNEDEYIESVRDGKTVYRSKTDGRKLTDYELKYRNRMREKLREPSNDYFWILNAIKASYGWAMTVNKAMAYSFDTILFLTDQGENRGRTNKDYFRWLYTGVSLAESQVILINWENITVFLNTRIGSEPVNLSSNYDRTLFTGQGQEEHLRYELEAHLEDCLVNYANIIDVKDKPYLKIMTLEMKEDKDNELVLHFYYNKNLEVRKARLIKGNSDHFKLISELLDDKPKDIPKEIQPITKSIERQLDITKWKVVLLEDQAWQFSLKFKKKDEFVCVQLYYDKKYAVSQFNYIEGNKTLFEELVSILIK